MERATETEIIEAASAMAQELQDLIDDAKYCGSTLQSAQAVLNDWEDVYKRTDKDWRFALSSRDKQEGQMDLYKESESTDLIHTL